MDKYKVKWTRLQQEIFRLFCIKAGQTLTLREIARILKVSPTAVSNSMGVLEKGEFLKIKKSKPFNLFSVELNRENRKVIELKQIENLRMVYDSGLHDFLFNEFPGCAIVLFGSYSKGEDVNLNKENCSDVDIAIIGAGNKKIDMSKFGKLLEREIILNFYKSWKEIHKYLKNNILGGIVLSGEVEL